MFRKASLPLVAVLALLLAFTGTAHASVTDKILRDCADDGVLQGNYTAQQLRAAKKQVKGDLAEYSDCADVIGRAANKLIPTAPSGGGTGGGGTGSGSGGSGGSAATGGVPGHQLSATTQADRNAIDNAAKGPPQPVTVAGSKLLAGAAPLRRGYRANGLPDSLIVALALLAGAGVALSLPPVRRRLLSLRRRP